MKNLKKVICYGASNLGKIATVEMPLRGYEIICFCDSDEGKWGNKINGYDVISPKELALNHKGSEIVITSMYVQEITEYLHSIGFYNIFPFRIREGDYSLYIQRMEEEFKNKDVYFLGINNLSKQCAGIFDTSGEKVFCHKLVDLEKYDKNALVIICLPGYVDTVRDLTGKGFFKTINGLYYLFYKKMYSTFNNFIDQILFSGESLTNQGEFGNEDLILEALCDSINISLPKYADIGCNLPVDSNNTYIFYKKGARGQLIEPNPRLLKYISQERPGDVLLPVGIGCETEKNREFFINTQISGLSTFNPGNTQLWENRFQKQMYEKSKVDLVSFNEVIDRDVQLVSMDSEGLDLQILKTIDFSLFKDLAIICVESFAALEYMREQGFKLFLKNYVNSIFIKEDLFEKVMSNKLCAEIYYGYACLGMLKESCF